MNRYKKFRVPTLDAVTAACAVYRQLGNVVKKAELNDTSPTSKTLIMDHLSGTAPVEILPVDQAQALEVTEYIRQRMMVDTLAGRGNSPFFLGVATLLEKETTSSSDLGILAWAPKLMDDLIARDDRNQDIRSALHDSRYLGTVDSAISLEFHTLECYYVKAHDHFVALGHDGAGNAVSFWSRHQVTGVREIRGRVRRHDRNAKFGNIAVTYINYVKFKK